MNVLIKRNIKLFFRDKTAVFFSLLDVLIIIVLYAVFLGRVWLPDSMANNASFKNTDLLMNDWLMAGILAVASVTTTFSAFGVMIEDKTKKISKDFYSSPIKKSSITLGYIGNAFSIGVIMSFITTLVAEIYIVANGGAWLSPFACLKVFLLILLTTMANTSMVCFIVSFFKSHSAFTTASTTISTLIGFLTGIYLPIGNLPESVQTVIKIFPFSHTASLFRQILMKNSIQTVFEKVPANYVNEFKEHMGITMRFGNYEVTPFISIMVLIATTFVFYGLTVLNMSIKRSSSFSAS